jgi:hypothetical protein
MVAVDCPYKAPIFLLPNGTIVIGLPPDGENTEVERLYEVRSANNFVVLGAFPRVSMEFRFPGDFEEFGLLGYSISDSAALE